MFFTLGQFSSLIVRWDRSTSAMTESAMGDSMDTDLLPEMSGETWVAAVHLDEATGDLTPPDSDPDLIASSLADKILMVVRDWDRSTLARAPPATSLQLVVPTGVRRVFIQHYHDSVFAGHLGVSWTVCRLLDRVNWPGLREDVRSYLASCSVCSMP